MNNEYIVKNLETIYEKIETLKPKEFNFNSYVEKCDKENLCGSVCCIVGWFPKWFVNSGVGWDLSDPYDLDIITPNGSYKSEVIAHLCNLTGLTEAWVKYLFYGEDSPVKNFPKLHDCSSLSEVKKAWRVTIKYFKTDPNSDYSLT